MVINKLNVEEIDLDKYTINVFGDTETGGLDDKTDGITEIGFAVFLVPKDGADEYMILDGSRKSFLLEPMEGKIYNEKALKLQGRSLAFLQEFGENPHYVYNQLIEYLMYYLGDPGEKCENWLGRLWFHNADFDFKFWSQFEKDIRFLASRDAIHTEYICAPVFGVRDYCSCTKRFYQILRGLGYHEGTKSSLDKASAQFELSEEGDQKHTALGDTLMSIRLLAALESLLVNFTFGVTRCEETQE